jgi:hypothetical protein
VYRPRKSASTPYARQRDASAALAAAVVGADRARVGAALDVAAVGRHVDWRQVGVEQLDARRRAAEQQRGRARQRKHRRDAAVGVGLVLLVRRQHLANQRRQQLLDGDVLHRRHDEATRALKQLLVAPAAIRRRERRGATIVLAHKEVGERDRLNRRALQRPRRHVGRQQTARHRAHAPIRLDARAIDLRAVDPVRLQIDKRRQRFALDCRAIERRAEHARLGRRHRRRRSAHERRRARRLDAIGHSGIGAVAARAVNVDLDHVGEQKVGARGEQLRHERAAARADRRRRAQQQVRDVGGERQLRTGGQIGVGRATRERAAGGAPLAVKDRDVGAVVASHARRSALLGDIEHGAGANAHDRERADALRLHVDGAHDAARQRDNVVAVGHGADPCDGTLGVARHDVPAHVVERARLVACRRRRLIAIDDDHVLAVDVGRRQVGHRAFGAATRNQHDDARRRRDARGRAAGERGAQRRRDDKMRRIGAGVGAHVDRGRIAANARDALEAVVKGGRRRVDGAHAHLEAIVAQQPQHWRRRAAGGKRRVGKLRPRAVLEATEEDAAHLRARNGVAVARHRALGVAVARGGVEHRRHVADAHAAHAGKRRRQHRRSSDAVGEAHRLDPRVVDRHRVHGGGADVVRKRVHAHTAARRHREQRLGGGADDVEAVDRRANRADDDVGGDVLGRDVVVDNDVDADERRDVCRRRAVQVGAGGAERDSVAQRGALARRDRRDGVVVERRERVKVSSDVARRAVVVERDKHDSALEHADERADHAVASGRVDARGEVLVGECAKDARVGKLWLFDNLQEHVLMRASGRRRRRRRCGVVGDGEHGVHAARDVIGRRARDGDRAGTSDDKVDRGGLAIEQRHEVAGERGDDIVAERGDVDADAIADTDRAVETGESVVHATIDRPLAIAPVGGGRAEVGRVLRVVGGGERRGVLVDELKRGNELVIDVARRLSGGVDTSEL